MFKMLLKRLASSSIIILTHVNQHHTNHDLASGICYTIVENFIISQEIFQYFYYILIEKLSYLKKKKKKDNKAK